MVDKFYTAYDRPEKDQFLEVNEGPDNTEKSGWMSIEDQLKRIVASGLDLTEYRRTAYNLGQGAEDVSGAINSVYPADVIDEVETLARMQSEVAAEREQQEAVGEELPGPSGPVDTGEPEQNPDEDLGK